MVTTVSKKLLRSLPVSRRTPAALREAISADDLTAFQKAFVAQIAAPIQNFAYLLDARRRHLEALLASIDMHPANRSREDIDRQIAEERASWRD